jgi:hypothetical protein
MKKLLLNKQQNSFIVTETYEGLCIPLEAFLDWQLSITKCEAFPRRAGNAIEK